MKRRVSRAHSNKHELRVISAANKLSLDRFHVIVDASFLRAILLSYWQEYEPLYQSRHSGGEERRRGGPAKKPAAPAPSSQKRFVSAYQYLRENVDEAFASSSVGGGSKTPSPRGGAHAKTSVFYYHVPETARTLRRLLSQPPAPTEGQQAGGSGAGRQGHGAKPGGGKHTKPLDATRIPEEVTGDLLSRLQRRGADNLTAISGPRNEGKAVAELVLSGLRDSAAGNYYFVASQSHDVRRLLPSRTGILRWTRQPNGVWLEQNGKEGLGDEAAGVRPLTSSSMLGGGPASGAGSQTRPRLSTADIAFMRHIGRSDHLAQPSPRKTRDPPPTPSDAASKGVGDAPSDTAAQGVEAAKPRPKRKRVHGGNPNPLSVKKKQKKEVFRIS